MKHLGIVTYDRMLGLSPDDQPLRPEFQKRGWSAVPSVWNDAAVDWSRFDALMRYCQMLWMKA